MPLITHIGIADEDVEFVSGATGNDTSCPNALRSRASEFSRELVCLPDTCSSDYLTHRWRVLEDRFKPLLRSLHAARRRSPVADDLKWLHDNASLLSAELQNTGEALRSFRRLPHARTRSGVPVPRIMLIAEDLLAVTEYQFSEPVFSSYIEAFQEQTVLNLAELWALVAVIKLVLLEQIAIRVATRKEDADRSHRVSICIRSLREVTQTSWKEVIEPLILFDRVLRQDPTGDYAGMDFESRDLYRKAVADIAEHCDFAEPDVARTALALAQESRSERHASSREANRHAHVGYYLVAEGVDRLRATVRYRPSLDQRLRSFVKEHPDEFYLSAIAAVTVGMMALLTLYMTPPTSSPALLLLTMLALLLPCSQSAVQLMNYLTISLLQPRILPKVDFEGRIPDDCVSLVAVPTLLLNENQVRRLVDDLEIRFLGNQDRNLHFALLTDLPDSSVAAHEDDRLVDLCAELIGALNQKYAIEGQGSFFLLHRYRVYNPKEGVWMGWERKRGKLLHLNALLRQQSDDFPVKVGKLSILPQVRFVITLDADTELPRGCAHRMIGTLAHPLNQAIIDRERNVVVAGYGILQPRVGVSVRSAGRSRLAKIYSGQTGLDIYTRAASDAYQDLYGEGSFAGKGIYEVDVLREVLDRRFPLNALLSHDLIEGAYARAGLVSDIEIIEDYPSHYSAYNRRKHRWLRGDWQVAEWLASSVPGESGNRVPNPISLISRWKILDNLRRSLVEPGIFLLLVLGWLVLPGSPRSWTWAAVTVLLIPALCRFSFDLFRAANNWKAGMVRDALSAFFTALVNAVLTLTFLAHQMLLSGDAIVRALVRKTVTGRRLLQWETAAEAESGAQRRTALDFYLAGTPALALGFGLLLWFARPRALLAAIPILLLWANSKLLSLWLDRPPRNPRNPLEERDEVFLRGIALRTWRYFLDFSTEEHHWLIPDNLREDPAAIAARVSPTNIGFLLNARQVACRFGYITVPEFVELTQQTLATIASLQRHRGHLFNWYDTRTLAPLPPRFISSVDSGNLAASLWTLEQGCLEQLRQPVLQPSLAEGFLDHLRLLGRSESVLPRPFFSVLRKKPKRKNWLQSLLDLADGVCEEPGFFRTRRVADADWLTAQARSRLEKVRELVGQYMPWQLPEFDALRSDPVLGPMMNVVNVGLDLTPEFIAQLRACLESRADATKSTTVELALQRLQVLLPQAESRARSLIQKLEGIAKDASKLTDDMDFEFLLNRRRRLLSIGFEMEAQQLHPSCYDLLASEARTSLFIAIAKDDLLPESWFSLGRAQTLDHGRPVLLSWCGTMFEYLMPSIWMHTYPDTLLGRSRIAAVRAQRIFAAVRRIPWGISESAYSQTNDACDYQYRAFGLPSLAMRKDEMEALVVSPYSTFLALQVDAAAALKNLRRMHRLGWSGRYGFYEAADFTASTTSWRHHEVVRCWMAHHQGISLLSIANFLHRGVVQRWFHANPRVQATELLLQEKPMAYVRPPFEKYGATAA
jgi:cyclic beta-1,2-glucan synthetase